MTELLPCPFCGSSSVDPKGWMSSDNRTGPACDECGGTTDTVERWNNRIPALAQTVVNPPEGATHMRRPEYITAWFYDLKARWPKWLVDKYTNTMPVPAEMVGRYATAIDGEFWRWLDAEKFNELYVPVSSAAQAPWQCHAKLRPEVSDCMWPDCGCEPRSTEIIAALVKQGWTPPLSPVSSTQSNTQELEDEAFRGGLSAEAYAVLPSSSLPARGAWSLHKQPKDQIADHEYSIWLGDEPVILANAMPDCGKYFVLLVDALNSTAPAPHAEVREALECARQAIEYSLDMGGTDPAGVLLQALNKCDAALAPHSLERGEVGNKTDEATASPYLPVTGPCDHPDCEFPKCDCYGPGTAISRPERGTTDA